MELVSELTQEEMADLESQIISALIFNNDDRSFILSKVNLEHLIKVNIFLASLRNAGNNEDSKSSD